MRILSVFAAVLAVILICLAAAAAVTALPVGSGSVKLLNTPSGGAVDPLLLAAIKGLTESLQFKLAEFILIRQGEIGSLTVNCAVCVINSLNNILIFGKITSDTLAAFFEKIRPVIGIITERLLCAPEMGVIILCYK